MPADLVTGSPRTHPVIGLPRARPANGSNIEALRSAAEAVRRARHLAPDASPRWRALLESHWRASLERVTELSLAYHDAEEVSAHAHDGPMAGGRLAGGQSRLLLRRAVAERRALAEIEAALWRLMNGCFGTCERCRVAMSARWLTRAPQARYCGACDR